MHHPVAIFLQGVYVPKNYENWLRVEKVIAMQWKPCAVFLAHSV